ncbi:DUF1684 domain-containing protein [Tsukamurella sp. NPDC003166]|uniref:DUF1684 domain-containing protein n=1 Tax=Tsukamurella sp. NPDC003166 TaxID=3154444 RepID=UPI00339FD222
MTTAATTFTDAWRAWRTEREAAATAPGGLAVVTGTHWLSDEPAPVEGVTGRWSRAGDRVVGDLGGSTVELGIGETAEIGGVTVRALSNPRGIGVRLFDDASPYRAGLAGIDAYEPDEVWVLPGRVTVPRRATVQVRHADGWVADVRIAADVVVTVEGREVTLAAWDDGAGALQVSFADSTRSSEETGFRFLSLPRGEGPVTVDFNRAYLPPSAFTPHYLCPNPPAGNTLDVAVEAGERRPRRR